MLRCGAYRKTHDGDRGLSNTRRSVVTKKAVLGKKKKTKIAASVLGVGVLLMRLIVWVEAVICPFFGGSVVPFLFLPARSLLLSYA